MASKNLQTAPKTDILTFFAPKPQKLSQETRRPGHPSVYKYRFQGFSHERAKKLPGRCKPIVIVNMLISYAVILRELCGYKKPGALHKVG